MAEQNPIRRCCRCEQFLPLTSFSTHVRHDRGGKIHVNSRCDTCGREAARERYENKKDHILKTIAAYRTNNREAVLERNRRYHYDHRDKILTKKREYHKRTAGSTEQKAKRRAYLETHREQIYANGRKYKQRHPERRRISLKKNKLKRLLAKGLCTPSQWLDKIQYFGWRCYLCGVTVASKTLHMDHRKPLVRGGSHWPANLAPACASCNLRKNSKSENEYRSTMRQKLGEKSEHYNPRPCG